MFVIRFFFQKQQQRNSMPYVYTLQWAIAFREQKNFVVGEASTSYVLIIKIKKNVNKTLKQMQF